MSKESIRIMVTSVGGGGVGMEAIKALRLSRRKYFILGTDMSDRSYGLFQADKGVVVPAANDARFVPEILKICSKEKIRAVIPGSEAELAVLSKRRGEFEKLDIYLLINSRSVIDLCLDKKKTFNYLRRKKITIPRTVAIGRKSDISKVDFLPAIIKPCVGTGGSRNVFVAQDEEELDFFCNYLMKYGSKPLVQEYVGSSNDEYTVGILSDREGELISAIVIRRNIVAALSNRLKIPSLKSKGATLVVSSGISQGEVVENKAVVAGCVRIAKAVNSKGPLNIQCRFVRGKVYPFEINPRISGTTHMRALAGVNEPDLLLRKYVLHERLPTEIKPKRGLVIRGLEEMFVEN
jgi:carbamoyl-phosphate synthase large subunit